MPRTYVDNAMNRSLGRVGMPHGSAVHSASSSGYSSIGFSSSHSSSGSRGSYVDNAMNRSLGRVGMEYGTAVHSRSSSSNNSTSSGSSRTYVDNPFNRSLGRVGMEHGTAVHSGSSGSNNSTSSGSSGTYVDNTFNRSLGRVGMEYGTAVHSRSSSSNNSTSSGSSGTYVDNPFNRSHGRVGMEHGTAVHSRPSSTNSSISESRGTYVDNAMNRKLGRVGMEYAKSNSSNNSSSSGSRGTLVDCSLNQSQSRVGKEYGVVVQPGSKGVYKNNPLNRRLGRVGKELGSMPYSKKKASPPTSAHVSPHHQSTSPAVKTYVDNPFNRKHNRVGLPLGSKPISGKKEVYKDTEMNRFMERVGKPVGSQPGKTNILAELLQYLREHSDEDLPPQFDDVTEDDIGHVLDTRQRDRMMEKFLEENTNSKELQPHEFTPTEVIQRYKGKQIDFNELEMSIMIGHGGFGEVYLAFLDGRAVAVKKLKYQHLTKKRLQLFVKEMELFVKLDHDNIVSFLGACTEMPNLAIVMEYMDASLYEAIHVRQEVDFSDNDKLEIMRGTTEGMAYLHKKNIAHCDLKTQNVLLLNVPGMIHYNCNVPVRAKITDFGLSQIKNDATTTTSVPVGQIGTLRYAAPEWHRGEILTLEQLKKADMFSLGLLIWELAVEEEPYENLTPPQLRIQVGIKGLEPQSAENVKLNKKLQATLSLCWNLDPDKRPSAERMAKFATTLDEFIEGAEE